MRFPKPFQHLIAINKERGGSLDGSLLSVSLIARCHEVVHEAVIRLLQIESAYKFDRHTLVKASFAGNNDRFQIHRDLNPTIRNVVAAAL